MIEYVSEKRQIDLSQQFPELLKVHHIENCQRIKKVAISVFDHWLNESEARDLLKIDKSRPTTGEELARRDLLNALNTLIAKSTECLGYEIIERNGHEYPRFFSFDTTQSLSKYFSQSPHGVSAQFFFKLVLPKLSALYFEGYDFTNHLYYLDENMIEQLKRWTAEANLYVLD